MILFDWVFDFIINFFNLKKLWNVIKNNVLSNNECVLVEIDWFSEFISFFKILFVIGRWVFIDGFNL